MPIKTSIISSLAAVAGLVLSFSVQATPIQFVYTGTGSGSIGANSFTDVSFVITEQSDTANLQSCGFNCKYIDSTSTSISLAGLGSFNFTTGTRTFDYSGLVGFSRAGSGGADLFSVFNVGGVYDLISAIGPVFGNASLLQWSHSPVNTNAGVLFFESASTAGSFEARIGGVSVPESSGLMLMLLGLVGLVAARRR